MLTCFVVSSHVFAQDKTTLLDIKNDFHYGKISAEEAVWAQLLALEEHSSHKCITPLTMISNGYWKELSERTRDRYRRKIGLVDVTEATQFFDSPSGKFRIQYETEGNDAVPLIDANSNSVPDYVEWVAEAADSSYRHEILTLGFTDPIPDGEQYLVIVGDLGAYGLTRPSPVSPGGTVIEIENDFVGFPTNTDPEGNQKGAIKVTMAHELKHAIEYVQTGWRGDVTRWAEMDATLMEEVVYDNVNDYYNYLDGFGNGNFFGSPNTTIIPGSYEDITWALFFHERFGDTFWSGVWSRITDTPEILFLEAIEDELTEFDVSFEEAVVENFLWHYASGGSNFTPFFGFDESGLYPSPRLEETFSEFQTELTEPSIMSRFSGEYYEFDLVQRTNSFLKLDFIPSSQDVQVAIIAYYDDLSVETRFITGPTMGELNSMESGLPWANIDRVGLVFFNSSTDETNSFQFQVYDYVPINIDSPQLSQNYPNPFNPNTTITVTLPFSQQVRLSVFDYLGREVRVLTDGVLGAGENPIRFDAQNLASGIYFYRLETEEKVVTRTMTLVK